jgi:kynurenine formamidase
MQRHAPTKEEVLAYLAEDRNWGRWGADDEVGAVNMVTPEKRAAAARLVKSGLALSLSREFPTTPAPNNLTPAIHYMKQLVRGEEAGAAVDYYGISYHGTATTHLDALCHTWDANGMWNGRKPEDAITMEGATFGAIDKWKEGIITRGVLLDVPKHRGEPYVTHDNPVHGWELEDIEKEQGVSLQPGDALVVYSGREKWNEDGNPLWGSNPDRRPGLHASCLKFIRQSDCCLLVWDMMDLMPHGYDLPWSVHGSIFAYGVGLLDNALLQPLAEACAQEGRYEFLLTVNPLRVVGGTGSPVNPVVLF